MTAETSKSCRILCLPRFFVVSLFAFELGISLHAQAPAGTAPRIEPDERFVSLIDAATLDGWRGDKTGKSVSNGVLEWSGGGHLWTEEEYDDFILRFEFTLSEGANHGLAIRWTGEGDPAYTAMCELQILDNEAPVYQAMDLDPRQYHGSAYGMAAAKRGVLRPAGEWNVQQVVVEGSQIRVTLNGTVILDADLAAINDTMGGRAHPGKDRTSGHLGLAGHGDKHRIQFRNLRILELERN